MDERNKEMRRAFFAKPAGNGEAEKKQVLEQMKKEPEVLSLMKRQNIPVNVLERQTYTFKRWLEETKPCRNCRGLNQCMQKQKGYRMGLTYDGILQETLEECAFEAEQAAKLKHAENYLISDLPSSFLCAGFDSLDLSHETRAYGQSVAKVFRLLQDHKGVYLYGNMGTGKTYLAACAANYVAKNGDKVVFLSMSAFSERVNRYGRSEEFSKFLSKCRYCDLLVLDDIGAEEVSTRGRSLLLNILDARMQTGGMTWFTSNADVDTLQNHYLNVYGSSDTMEADRIRERIRAIAVPVFLEGNDRRTLY